jgi:hypothetical protein
MRAQPMPKSRVIESGNGPHGGSCFCALHTARAADECPKHVGMTLSGTRAFGPLAVAIPARDEVGHIEACVSALDAQRGAQLDHIVLCVNNTSDGTAEAARRLRLRPGTTLHLLEPTLPPDDANAGHARRLAMDLAASLVGGHGIILTTDADAVVDPDWLSENLAALEAGADAVAGWVDLDPQDWAEIPLKLHEDDARECAYDALCDELHARLDPDPADPLPRHTQHSGASIAVTAHFYGLCGGMPAVKVGEDRAFFAALRHADARIRHAPACHVSVSGRLQGRAAGGMADTIRRRMTSPETFLDDRLEPADSCARRADLRRRLRACLADHSLVSEFAEDVALDAGWVLSLVRAGSLGKAWTAIEESSEVLRRRRVAVADLPEQMARAEELCRRLRLDAQAESYTKAELPEGRLEETA